MPPRTATPKAGPCVGLGVTLQQPAAEEEDGVGIVRLVQHGPNTIKGLTAAAPPLPRLRHVASTTEKGRMLSSWAVDAYSAMFQPG